MLYLKRLDLFIQFLLPIFGILIAFFSNFWMGFYVGATGIGFSQIMSLFLHLPAKKEFWYQTKARKWYSYLLVFQLSLELTGITVFFLSDEQSTAEYFFSISCLIVGTILTVTYWIICSLEIQNIRDK
jgi:hypothetical protein